MPLGASFSQLRAASAGLDSRRAFGDLLSLDLDPIRLSANWEAIDRGGYGELDWQLDEAGRAGRSGILTAGIKGNRRAPVSYPAPLPPPAPPVCAGRATPAAPP